LGELPETVNLLVSAATRLLKAYKHAKEGNLTAAFLQLGVDPKDQPRSLGSKIAGASLEYQYGWRPLMLDIYNLAEAIQNGLEQPVSKDIVVKKEENFTFESRNVVKDHSQRTYDGSGKYVAKAGIVIYVDDPTLARLGAHGLTNPMALAWELFPLSFVVDWFIPIKPFLEGLTTHLGLKFDDGYFTKYVEWECSVRLETVHDGVYQCPNNDRFYHKISGHLGERWDYNMSHQERLECFTREILPFPPPPVPYWDPGLNLSKVGSLLSLLAGVLAS
jgi:hypothetical protein